jgi:hypothetical protein
MSPVTIDHPYAFLKTTIYKGSRMTRRLVSPLAAAYCVCVFAVLGSSTINAASAPQPIPTLAPSVVHQASIVLNGFSTALLHRDVRRARSFLSPHYFQACNQYLGRDTEYLRCLLDGTPIPFRFRIRNISFAAPHSKELIATMIYYFHLPGQHIMHYQPFYLNLLSSPHGLWIDSGGLPRG